jgi:hypothetical protein
MDYVPNATLVERRESSLMIKTPLKEIEKLHGFLGRILANIEMNFVLALAAGCRLMEKSFYKRTLSRYRREWFRSLAFGVQD